MRRVLTLAAFAALQAWGAPRELQACGIAVASAGQRPAPVRWEPCRFASGCRQMVTDWPVSASHAPYRVAAGAAAEVNAAGRVTLMFGRVTADGIWRLVADADGPVHFAALETSARCALGLPSLAGGRFAWRLYDSEVKQRLSEYGGAALTGRLGDSKLELVGSGSQAAGRRFVATRAGVVELDPGGGLALWSPRRRALAEGPDVAAALREVNGALFWQAHREGETVRLRVGTRELVAGAADFGSDGRTMAWAELHGREVRLFTAPFTDVPERLQRRALATVPAYGFGVWPVAVGRRHAARMSAGGVLVFDLATGARRELAAPAGVTYRELLAVTEREVFVMSDVAHVPTLLRLELETPR